jgi:peptide/nickel transport system substrate-binding protein
MRIRKRGSLAVAGLAVLAMAAAACGSSGSTNNTTSNVSLNSGLQGLNPGGTPHKGGTLNMIGVGDVDYMDYNASYYTIGYLAQRLWDRGLYAYPAIPGKVTTVEPDLATAMPVVSNGGKTYTVTIRSGADWNTTPPRQITAADVILGMKRACNPTPTHFGGLADYEAVVVGYTQFCAGFAAVSPTSLTAINKYMNTHQISGVKANGETLTINLTQPSSYLPGTMTMDSWDPAPIESEKYLPGSAASAQHMIADGPYQIKSYVPGKSIDFVRNPAWNASTDPIRKAYVNAINVTETSTETTAQSVLETGGPSGGMEFNAFPPEASLPGLIDQMKAGNKDFNLGPSYGSNPYLDFNTISPNNNHALANVKVRQAIFDAIDRTHLIQDLGGPDVSPPLTHILPDGIDGSQDVPKGFDPYSYDPAKAKALLKAAGYPNGLKLTVVYNAESTTEPRMFQTMQADMAPAGIKLKALAVPSADLYVKYMYGPSTAKDGTWDIGMVGWGPDWYGSSALSFFNPLYSCASVVPAGSNYTYYCNKSDDALIASALKAPSEAAADKIWAQLDENITNAAVTFQITQGLQANYHSSFVHNAVYVPALQNFDPANVWLSNGG